MSTNLFAEPISKRPKVFGSELRDIITALSKSAVDASDIPFLEGVIAAARSKELKQDTNELIQMILDHETVRLWQE